MRFQVPQFIDVEDKVFGPLTVKQFIYLAGGAGLSFIVWDFLPLWIGIFIIIPVVLLSLGLAFYKVNSRSLVAVLESAFTYSIGKKLYVWRRQEKKPRPDEETAAVSAFSIPKLSDSKLKDLTWSLDIKEHVTTSGQKK